MKQIIKILIFLIAFLSFAPRQAQAAEIYMVSDQISRLKVGTPAGHKIKFKVNENLLKGYSIEIDFTDFQIRSSAFDLKDNVTFFTEPPGGSASSGFLNNQRVLADNIANGDLIEIVQNKILRITLSDGGGNSALIPKDYGLEITIGNNDPFILNAATPIMVKTYFNIYDANRRLIAKSSAANVILVNDQVGVGGEVERGRGEEEGGLTGFLKRNGLPENAINFLNQIGDFFKKIGAELAALLEKLAKTIVGIPLFVNNKNLITAVVVSIALIALIFPGLFNLELLAPFNRLLAYFNFLFQRRKKEKPWGFVYDSESRKPIELADVSLYEKEYGKKIASQFTDINGRFNFLILPGKYYLKVVKNNFIFPSKFISTEYRGEPIEIKKETTLSLKIPLDPELPTLTHRIIILDEIRRILRTLKYPLLVIGTLATASFYYFYKDFADLIFLLLYAVMWAFEIAYLFKKKSYGVVLDQKTHQPLARSIIRFFDARNKLLFTKVTDDRGHFSALISPGKFNLQVAKDNYKIFREELDIKKEGALIGNIEIAPLAA